jgi:hypothetical protein
MEAMVFAGESKPRLARNSAGIGKASCELFMIILRVILCYFKWETDASRCFFVTYGKHMKILILTKVQLWHIMEAMIFAGESKPRLARIGAGIHNVPCEHLTIILRVVLFKVR